MIYVPERFEWYHLNGEIPSRSKLNFTHQVWNVFYGMGILSHLSPYWVVQTTLKSLLHRIQFRWECETYPKVRWWLEINGSESFVIWDVFEKTISTCKIEIESRMWCSDVLRENIGHNLSGWINIVITNMCMCDWKDFA